MADTSVPNMTEDTSPGSDSLIYTVDDPAGTPADRKVTLANVAKGITTTETVYIPATSMKPETTNGAAAVVQTELTAGQPELVAMAFDATADEHAQFSWQFPDRWDESTITFKAHWTSTATDTDGVAWGLQAVAIADGDAIATDFGTAVVVTDDAQGTARDMYITAESGAVTVAGSPAAGEHVYFRIFRDVSDANDDMTEDAELIGVTILWGAALQG